MKIKLFHGDTVFEFERQPMPQERFTALCSLAKLVIGGTVLLVAVHMEGIVAAVLAAVALAVYGLFRLFREDFS